MTTTAEEVLSHALSGLPGIGLPELMSRADLQTRTDRKYFVPAAAFAELTSELADDHAVLDIDGRRLFGYLSVYFDSQRSGAYRAHLQRRRHRYKIRTRTYLDSGECMLELKLSGQRGGTVKVRSPYSPSDRMVLTPRARLELGQLVREAYGVRLPRSLDVALTTEYRRGTLVAREAEARVTCDVGLLCRAGGRELRARNDYVLVEVKSARGTSRADQLLLAQGIRPAAISKFCAGMGALHPELPANPWHRTLRRYFDWPGLAEASDPARRAALIPD